MSVFPWSWSVKEMYHEGHGTKINKRRAGRWFLKAAEQGRKEAQYNVAMMYHFGTASASSRGPKSIMYWLAFLVMLESFFKVMACQLTDQKRQSGTVKQQSRAWRVPSNFASCKVLYIAHRNSDV